MFVKLTQETWPVSGWYWILERDGSPEIAKFCCDYMYRTSDSTISKHEELLRMSRYGIWYYDYLLIDLWEIKAREEWGNVEAIKQD